jgi:MHS family citrate/tricarballylate:H+ symporter-like MFS transporter
MPPANRYVRGFSTPELSGQVRAVIRVASGNFLEMYDFIVFGYYALYIAKTFFPAETAFTSLMLSFATFGSGYLMRPVGAVFLGAYIDRKGRREGLLLTLSLMAVGTLTIALTPGYSRIGILAPTIIVIGRLLQGLSAGVELGGVSIYLAEIATEGHRGFYCSWQSASQQAAVIFTALIGLLLTGMLSNSQMILWGWRIPFLIGCFIIPLVLWLRQSLEETSAFVKMKGRPRKTTEVFLALAANWRIVLIGMMLSVFTTTFFYLITVYTPTFGQRVLHLVAKDSFLVILFIGVSNFIWVPIGGVLSDRIGRYQLLLAMPIVALLTVYPLMFWLTENPAFVKLLLVELWFSLLYGMYNGAMIPLLAEVVPKEIRTAGFALSYSLATAIFGGLTPAVCTALIEYSGNKASPAWWLLFGATISFAGVAICHLKKYQNQWGVV